MASTSVLCIVVVVLLVRGSMAFYFPLLSRNSYFHRQVSVFKLCTADDTLCFTPTIKNPTALRSSFYARSIRNMYINNDIALPLNLITPIRADPFNIDAPVLLHLATAIKLRSQ